MSEPIERVTIVGGGTAGWLTALILNAYLNATGAKHNVKLALIELPDIPTIGVGEATIITLRKTLQGIGIDEAEFFRRTNAAFKMSVRFSNWFVDSAGRPLTFYNPFNNPTNLGDWPPFFHYLKFGPRWPGTPLADSIGPNLALIRAGKGPRTIELGNYGSHIAYAYHIDAGLFAQYMREVATSRGIQHIRDNVVDVSISEDGGISALQLKDGGHHPVDFVIDCTGFRSLIIGRLQKRPFVSLENRLLNDRAIPVQIPHRNPQNIEPCTRATGLAGGWVWRVPLYSRVGTGYVYSSAFRSDDEARSEFFEHLREIGDLAPGAPDPETRVIKIRAGYSRESWIKNCVAIGLSGGFVEPLEATAIHTIERAVTLLLQNFPDRSFEQALARRYNAQMERLYENVIDFIQTHYVTSNRPEPYWRAARNDLAPPDGLREQLELWRYRLPVVQDTAAYELFGFWNYVCVLQPKGYFKDTPIPCEASVRLGDWHRFNQSLEARKAELVAALPDHYRLLTAIRMERAEFPPRVRNFPRSASSPAAAPLRAALPLTGQ